MHDAPEFFRRLAGILPAQPKDLSQEQILDLLAQVADLLDDFEIHDHNMRDNVDLGWFRLRDLLYVTQDCIIYIGGNS